MAETADVVIVGGGIFGCAVAWNLRRLGVERVVLLERNQLAAATTSRAAALVSCVRSDPAVTALVTETRRALVALEEELGDSLDAHRVGSLHVAASERSEAALRELARLAARCGEPLLWIDRDEAGRRVPWLRLDDARCIASMPGDLYVDPYRFAMAYAGAARRRGAVLRCGVEVVGLLRDEHRVRGVRTRDGVIHADWVVDAAGPWAGLLAHEAGGHLPMAPVRSHYWITEPAGPLRADQSYVVLPDAQAYARYEVGGLLFGLRTGASPSWDPRTLPAELGNMAADDPGGHDALAAGWEALARFVPGLPDWGIARYIAGPSTYTPDGRPVLGTLPGVSGFAVCAGCCGAGIALSGGVGRSIAELVAHGTSVFDLASSRPDRFGVVDAFGEPWRRRCSAARAGKTAG